jgi:hypothetical protein
MVREAFFQHGRCQQAAGSLVATFARTWESSAPRSGERSHKGAHVLANAATDASLNERIDPGIADEHLGFFNVAGTSEVTGSANCS